MKPRLLLLTGIPGSGKTTYVNKLKGYQIISLDDIRLALGQVYNPRTEPVVKMMVDVMRVAYMTRGVNLVIDGNILYFFLYQKWEKLAEQFGYEIEVVYFNTPLARCIKHREGVIGEDIIKNHWESTFKLLEDFDNNDIIYSVVEYFPQ